MLSGFTGVPATQFAVGASLGALGTMPIQLTIVSDPDVEFNTLVGYFQDVHGKILLACPVLL